MRRQYGNGYTIIEVLIVIAVTAAMFVVASAAFSGRQEQVQFDQAVRDFEASLQDIINDVSTGYYPANDQISCSVSATTANPPVVEATGNGGIGTNNQCLYIGKAIQFVPTGVSDNSTKYYVYNLVGKRHLNSTSAEAADTIATVRPTAVASTTNPYSSSFPDTIQEMQTRYGLTITRVFERLSPSTLQDFGVITMLSNFGGTNVSSADSDGQNIRIAGIRSATTRLNASKESAVALINRITESSSETEGYINLTNSSGTIICLFDGDRRRASIELGVSGSALTVLRIGDYATECNP